MATGFRWSGGATSPGKDAQATWTREDRDYIWLSRALNFKRLILTGLPGCSAAWCLAQGFPAHGPAKLAYLIAAVAIIFATVTAGTSLILRSYHRMERRFPSKRERQLYARRASPPSIGHAINALEPVDHNPQITIQKREAILEPLRRRVAWFRSAFQRVAIAQLTIAVVSLAYAASDGAALAHQVRFAIEVAAACVLSAATWPAIWNILIYDVPARINPLWAPVDLSGPMAAVLQDACDDEGEIWLAQHKIVPRGLFKTPFGPLLLGEFSGTASLPLGLWCRPTRLVKDMSREILEIETFRKMRPERLAHPG